MARSREGLRVRSNAAADKPVSGYQTLSRSTAHDRDSCQPTTCTTPPKRPRSWHQRLRHQRPFGPRIQATVPPDPATVAATVTHTSGAAAAQGQAPATIPCAVPTAVTLPAATFTLPAATSPLLPLPPSPCVTRTAVAVPGVATTALGRSAEEAPAGCFCPVLAAALLAAVVAAACNAQTWERHAHGFR